VAPAHAVQLVPSSLYMALQLLHVLDPEHVPQPVTQFVQSFKVVDPADDQVPPVHEVQLEDPADA